MIKIRINEEASTAFDMFKDARPRVIRAMVEEIDYQNELTVGHIQKTKLSRRGPETLGVITNRLRSSLRPARAQVVGDRIVSGIGSNVAYMGVHEFGFEGTVTVRTHSRRIAGSVETTTVRTHDRKVSIKARAPIQKGLKERHRYYGRGVSEAILDAVKQGGGA